MKKSKSLKKVMLLTIAIIAIVSVVGVSYAAWANKLNADKVFEIKAAEVTHLTFGGQNDIAIDGFCEPGMTMSSAALVKSSNVTLSVKFTLSKIEVKLSGSDTFQDIKQVVSTDINLFSLVVEGSNNNTVQVGKTETSLNFKFTMRAENVNTEKYPNATFRLTVAAVGSLPR